MVIGVRSTRKTKCRNSSKREILWRDGDERYNRWSQLFDGHCVWNIITVCLCLRNSTTSNEEEPKRRISAVIRCNNKWASSWMTRWSNAGERYILCGGCIMINKMTTLPREPRTRQSGSPRRNGDCLYLSSIGKLAWWSRLICNMHVYVCFDYEFTVESKVGLVPLF